MPELPEVSSIRSQLDKFIVGHKIVSIDIRTQKIFIGDPHVLVGAEIKAVRRFAKVLSIDTNKGFSIVIHVKLTGQLLYRGPNLPDPKSLSRKVIGGVPGPHTHVIFTLDRNGFLYFNDMRKFGWVKLMKTDEVQSTGFIAALGPEPFGLLTPLLFYQILQKSKRPIKVVLMDQSKIGGIGNIYANDALWLSEIHPSRPASYLTVEESGALFDSLLTVLKKGIEQGGASELMFVTPDGQEGNYQNFTLVYGRQGELCRRCQKEKISKCMLGGRGTYICPVCQKV
jgi:formamidopyrimidine-DNA glycosylase